MTEHSSRQDSGGGTSGLVSFGAALVLLSILGGGLSLWSSEGAALFPSGKWLALTGGLLVFVSLFFRPSFSSSGFALALCLVFASDWLCRGYNLFQGPSIRGEIILFALLTSVLLAKRRIWLTVAAAPLFSIVLIWTFLSEAGGRPLFSDDHATFIYRLTLLKQSFPFIPFYYPLWNAGLDARDFFATGALNVFLIFSPLIYAFPVEKIYNLVVSGLLFALTPLCTLLAARLAKLSWRVCLVAALLSLSPSLLWLRWGLKYGTLGFVTSAALMPLVFSLGCLVIDRSEPVSWKKALLFLASFSLMLLWTPAGLAVLPLIGIGLLRAPALIRKPGIIKLAFALLALNLPWISLFWSVSNVSGFLKSETPAMHAEDSPAAQLEMKPMGAPYKHRAEGFDLGKSLRRLRESAVSTHPLILLMIIPGLLLLPRSHRLNYGLGAVWLVVLGSGVAAMKPQLEFDRMLVMLALLGCVPAAAAIEEVFQNGRKGLAGFLGAALVGGFLLTGPFTTSSVILNRSLEHFGFASSIVSDLAKAIKEHGGDGRTVFSGFVLHDLSGGHVAPLSFMTQKPLIASSPFHNMWRYREAFSSEAIAGGAEGISRYLDLFNVSSVITHTQKWRDFFLALPDEYEQVWQNDRFRIFRRKNFENNYFLEGSGEILEQGTSFIRLKAASETALIKFRWFPFLRSSDCSIAGKDVAEETSFIELKGCTPGTEIKIEAGNPLDRIMGGNQ